MITASRAAVVVGLGIAVGCGAAERVITPAQPALDVPAAAVWAGCARPDHAPWPAYRDRAGSRDGPRLLRLAAYEYPARAARTGIVGTVKIAALVCEHGYVVDVRIVQSVPGLDAAAMACVRRWEFQPAMRKGRPVACWTVVPVEFMLPMDSWSDPQR